MKETYQKRSRPCFQHVRLQKNPSPFKRDIQKIPVKETYNPCTPCFQLVRLYVRYKSKRDIPKRHLENTCRSDLQSIYTLFSACPSSRSVSVKKNIPKRHSKKTFKRDWCTGKRDLQTICTLFSCLTWAQSKKNIPKRHSKEIFKEDLRKRRMYTWKRDDSMYVFMFGLYSREIFKRGLCAWKGDL